MMYKPKIKYLNGMTVLILTYGSLMPSLMLYIDTLHSPISYVGVVWLSFLIEHLYLIGVCLDEDQEQKPYEHI